MMPHLGVLAQVHPQASLEVFERDCLIYLGTCVAAKGTGKAGKPCFRYSIRSATLNESGQMMVGDLRLFPLGEGETRDGDDRAGARLRLSARARASRSSARCAAARSG